MGLINQLLDIRKAEQGQMRLNFVREDLGRIISHTLELFRQAAQEQGIRIRTDLPEKHISAMCARDAVEHILSNLISNAFKYGRDEIGVSLSLDAGGEKALIRVDSNGQHISEKEAEKIFEAFYQIPDVSARIKENAGTGLGLPFARSLASMHGGRLYLDTAVADVNSFVLELPLFQPEDSSMEPLLDRTESEPVQNLEEPDGSKLVLLLVEDESGLRQYMASQLADEYAILQASNGQEALNVIREYRVDLIISDILMPVMDGCELCNTIKNDIEFSHIPIILLTAAAGLDTHLKTLDSGADGYLEKPFEMSLLRANIKNLFKNREIVFKQFTDSPLTHLKSVSMNKVENDFMVRVHNIILENIADPNLSIDSLCKTLNTSKSTLYRKIKADTGMNANEYIRLCRLKKAAEMLSNSSSRVNEVAYLVGFSSLSYFTAIFKKQFNVSPSAFMREQKEKKKVG